MFKPIAALTAAALASTAPFAAAQSLDWRYTDAATPERWSQANPEYAACDAGMMQSPIELTRNNALGEVWLATSYGTADATLKLGTHKVQIDTPAGMGMISGGMLFNLVQVHFHTPAEHAIDGMRYPLTGHFVHATADGTLGVLGVMFEEGEANEGLQSIIDGIGRGNDTRVSVDLEEMLPDDRDVYRYQGSLTTPPCSENVNWHVLADPVEASAQQIATLGRALGFSARTLQPVNNRLVIAPGE